MSRKLIIGLVVVALLLIACFGVAVASNATEGLHALVNRRLSAMSLSLADQISLEELSRGEGSLPGCGVDLVERVLVVPAGFFGRCRFNVADSNALNREISLSLVDGGSAIRVNLVLALEDGETATLGDTISLDEDEEDPLTLNIPDGSFLIFENCAGSLSAPCILVVR